MEAELRIQPSEEATTLQLWQVGVMASVIYWCRMHVFFPLNLKKFCLELLGLPEETTLVLLVVFSCGNVSEPLCLS